MTAPEPVALLGPDGHPAEHEALQVLTSMARSKPGPVRAEILARHVVSVTPACDLDVRRGALEALLRRVASARAADLEIRVPGRRGASGLYRVRRKGSSVEYRALLRATDPPSGSCDCPDFLRSSLGLCKHLLAILAGSRGLPGPRSLSRTADGAHLRWDPVRPLTGPGDWLARVRWHEANNGGERTIAAAASRRWFRRGDGPMHVLAAAHADEPERRLQLVIDLLRHVRSSEGVSDPSLEPLLAAEEERLRRVSNGACSERELKRLLGGLKERLYPYQLEGVRRFLAVGRLLLADDMGLGKTAQAVAACHALFTARKVVRGLIVAPASLKSQWLREWQHFSALPVAVVEGSREARARMYRATRRGFLIANYEQVIRDLPTMRAFRPGIVVLDEAQRIKNWATKTAISTKQLQSEYRLVLTGTPMENRLDELASLLEWIDDMALEPKWRLSSAHAIRTDGEWEASGARNLETLRVRLAGPMLRRRRTEVLTQLPPRTDTRVSVPLTPEQQAEHDELNRPIAVLVATAGRRPLTQAEFLRLMTLLNTQRVICNGLGQARFEEMWPAISAVRAPTAALLESLFSPKLIELRELLANVAVAQERKVVVFSQWRRMLRLASWAVSDVLGQARVESRFFTGEESQKRRTENVVAFHDDPKVRVLFATDAGGVGLNLQRAANCCVSLDLPWNPAVLEQRVGRIYRMGQSRPVEVYHLLSEGGIESRLVGLVSDKKALFSGLFDGETDQVSFAQGGSFLSRIERVLPPAAEAAVPDAAMPDPEDAPGGEVEPEAADALPREEAVDAPPSRTVKIEPGMQELVAGLDLRRGEDGSMVIHAAPATASALATLFESWARRLRSANGQGAA